MDLKELLPYAVTLGGWCIMIGVYKNKIKVLEDENKAIKQRQENDFNNLQNQITATNTMFNSVKDSLNSLNTKIDLLLNGQLANPWSKENG